MYTTEDFLQPRSYTSQFLCIHPMPRLKFFPNVEKVCSRELRFCNPGRAANGRAASIPTILQQPLSPTQQMHCIVASAAVHFQYGREHHTVRCSAFSMLSTMVSPSCSSQQLQKAALSADNIALSADKTQQSNGKKVQCSQQKVFPSDKLGQFWISIREDLNHFYRRVVILDLISQYSAIYTI